MAVRKATASVAAPVEVAKKAPVSLFASAKKFEGTAPGAKPAPVLVPMPNTGMNAAIKKIRDTLDSIESMIRTPMRERAVAHWIADAVRTGKRPDNFRGVEGTMGPDGKWTIDHGKQASFELRKRSTASSLKPEEMTALEADNIPFEIAPMKKGTSSFQLNPKYETDSRLQEWGVKMAEVGMPEDMFVSATKPVVSEDSLTQVFMRRANETDQQYTDRITRLLPIVTVFAVKPVGDGDITDAFATVLNYVTEDKETASEQLLANLKASVKAAG